MLTTVTSSVIIEKVAPRETKSHEVDPSQKIEYHFGLVSTV